jgi:hypothetical protein
MRPGRVALHLLPLMFHHDCRFRFGSHPASYPAAIGASKALLEMDILVRHALTLAGAVTPVTRMVKGVQCPNVRILDRGSITP